MAEALIRQRVEDCVKALRATDIDGVMSLYAPNIVSFDIIPPLRYVGADNKRRAWHYYHASMDKGNTQSSNPRLHTGQVFSRLHELQASADLSGTMAPTCSATSFLQK
jgi:ketosteroid isomerase-like protein